MMKNHHDPYKNFSLINPTNEQPGPSCFSRLNSLDKTWMLENTALRFETLV